MKKIIIMTIAALAVLTASAQNEPGRFTIQPKVGVSLNNVAGIEDLKSQGVVYASKKKMAGFLVGVEFEYQVSPLVSFAAGINYSTMGCRWQDFNANVAGVVRHIENPRMLLGYVNVPIVANFYVFKGLALKAGIQMGVLTNAHLLYQYDQASADHSSTAYSSINIRRDCHKFDFTIPVGASYQFGRHFIVDARYNIGTTWVTKRVENIVETGATANSSVLVTFGYKFDL